MAEISRKRASGDGGDSAPVVRKKIKIRELPTTQAQNAAIDNLVQTFRKKGEFDAIRSLVRSQFGSGPGKAALLKSLEELVDRETDRNPSLLSKPPAMAASLVEGAGAYSDIYKPVHDTVAALISQFMETQGLAKMREYRIQEVGAEVAAEEEKRGSKSEEDWAREADARREEREAVREKEREKEERARKEERRRREREEEEAREKARQEREERRRKEREERDKEDEERRRQDRERAEKEREERRARQKREDEERDAEREARLKRIREEDRERERRLNLDRERSRERRRGSRARSRTPIRGRDRDRDRDRGRRRTRSRSRRTPEPIRDVKPEDIKVDDDLALQALLQESEAMKKSRQRPTLERSGSLEPPTRKAQPPKSLVPRDPVAARLAAIETKSQSPMNKSPSKLEALSAASPAATTPSAIRDEDTPMEDAPPIRSVETTKSRWDQPPPSRLDQKSRGRSRSYSVTRSVRKRSRTRSPGSRYDRRSSRVEDDRRSRRDDERHSVRVRDDSRRRDRDRDGREDRRSRRDTRSPSKDRRKSIRSPSPKDRRRDRRRSPSRSRSRSRGDTRRRDRSPPPRRRNRSRSRTPDGIDRYIPGGGAASGGGGADSGGSRRKRNDSRGRGYRSRDYDRWDGDRAGRSRLQDSDRYLPGRESKDDDRDRDRDRDRERDRNRDRDRDGDRDRDRRRRDGSRNRSRSRRRSRSRSRRR